MWPLFVVLNHPPLGGLPDLAEVAEQVKIEQFIPVGSVKAFNIGVLVGLPGLNILDHHAGSFRPGEEFAA